MDCLGMPLGSSAGCVSCLGLLGCRELRCLLGCRTLFCLLDSRGGRPLRRVGGVRSSR
jgi:hypothetical protein